MKAYDNQYYGEHGSRRIVEIYITDPDPSVPIDKAVLYHADRFATELVDSELFMRVGITDLLDKHNAVRATTRDKRYAESEVFLEPVTGKELRYTVRTITAI